MAGKPATERERIDMGGLAEGRREWTMKVWVLDLVGYDVRGGNAQVFGSLEAAKAASHGATFEDKGDGWWTEVGVSDLGDIQEIFEQEVEVGVSPEEERLRVELENIDLCNGYDVESRAGEGREIIGRDPPSPAGGLSREEIEALLRWTEGDPDAPECHDVAPDVPCDVCTARAKLRAYLGQQNDA